MWCGSRPNRRPAPSRLRPSAAPRTAALPLVGGGMARGRGGFWAPAPPGGRFFAPRPPLRGFFGFGNVVGCALVLRGCAWASISARFARFGGRYASTSALNYVKVLLTMSRFFLAHFGLFLPRCLLQFFAHAPKPLRHGSGLPPFQLPVNSRFGTYRKKAYLCPQLAVPAFGIPAGGHIHEVVYRPKAIGPMVADAHPPNNPSNLGGTLQAVTLYVANAPHGINKKRLT